MSDSRNTVIGEEMTRKIISKTKTIKCFNRKCNNTIEVPLFNDEVILCSECQKVMFKPYWRLYNSK